ncbi:hypothetical protein [Spirosoma arcticum]
MKSFLSLWLVLMAGSAALSGITPDTLPCRATQQPKTISRQAPAPIIMPGTRLDKRFNELPAQSPAVGKAAPAWLRAKFRGSPMYVVNGKGATAGQLRALSQQNVASVSVLEGSRAVALYGKNVRNGMVLITTKIGLRP